MGNNLQHICKEKKAIYQNFNKNVCKHGNNLLKLYPDIDFIINNIK